MALPLALEVESESAAEARTTTLPELLVPRPRPACLSSPLLPSRKGTGRHSEAAPPKIEEAAASGPTDAPNGSKGDRRTVKGREGERQ